MEEREVVVGQGGFYADLHIHSKFSRATSRDCDLEHLAVWARKKGISVLGTGDFTHPGWLKEIEEKLVPAEPGLFRLREDLEKEVEASLGGLPGPGVRFMLQVEISTIYKKDGRTRKVHHLVFAPDLEKARRLRQALERIGNLASDGRPILGLDSRDLLEITLEAGEGCYLIPAHIWTPWFAVLGSSSGFDSVEECYGDLSREIFALETGLSSDPPMNRRLSRLDRYALVSNSDAHSPSKIAREACVFTTGLDYFAMRRALESGEGYGGTVEFFAEEGKYHFDGHRKCGVCLSPEETRRNSGLCPACGKPPTLGVMHRVLELADRDEGAPGGGGAPFRSLIPLAEVLAEIHGTAPEAKAVRQAYERLLSRLGPELLVLESAGIDDIERGASGLVAEAISRMREGKVIRQPGFDGEYGRIRLFKEGELDRRTSGSLFDLLGIPPAEEPPPEGPGAVAAVPPEAPAVLPREDASEKIAEPADISPKTMDPLAGLDAGQRSAAEATEGPLLILAGPGTGKTRVLTHRIAHLVLDLGVPPGACLAITFTRRAAGEMAGRLSELLGSRGGLVPVMTFHSLGLAILREHGERLGLRAPIRVAGERERGKILEEALSITERSARRMLERISRWRREGRPASEAEETARAFAAYERRLREEGLVDFDDLVALAVELLEAHPDLVERSRSLYPWISVDECQDMDPLEYRLVRLLAGAGGKLCMIGDPDQSIYGFRGADAGCFRRFPSDFPSSRTVSLGRNYRSTRAIVEASLQMILPESLVPDRRLEAGAEGPEAIEVHECPTDRSEAEFVVRAIEGLIGGSSFFSFDSGRAGQRDPRRFSFADFAVLYRTGSQAACLVEAFQRSGLPFQRRSHAPLAEVPCVQAVARSLEEEREDLPEAPIPDLLERAAGEVSGDDPEIETYLPALRSLALRHPGDLEGFLSELALGIDCDLWDPRAEAISLLTLHASKGLEFPVVFIVACEDGILPLRRDGERDDIAEERRLFFVGMTRARERLVLTRARRRAWRGSLRSMEASPFLQAIEERLRAFERHGTARAARPEFRQLTIFEGE